MGDLESTHDINKTAANIMHHQSITRASPIFQGYYPDMKI
jgi:hypothetical protein